MRRTALRFSATVAIGLAAIVCSGCDEKQVNGDSVTYRFAAWIGCSAIAAGLACIPAGWLILRHSNRWSNAWLTGAILLIGAPVILLGLLAPSMYSDRVVVDADHFETTYGFWFSPTSVNVRFDDLNAIQVRAKVRQTRRGKQVTYDLHCARKSGGVQIVPAGDLMRQALDDVLARAQRRGVAVSRAEPEN